MSLKPKVNARDVFDLGAGLSKVDAHRPGLTVPGHAGIERLAHRAHRDQCPAVTICGGTSRVMLIGLGLVPDVSA